MLLAFNMHCSRQTKVGPSWGLKKSDQTSLWWKCFKVQTNLQEKINIETIISYGNIFAQTCKDNCSANMYRVTVM